MTVSASDILVEEHQEQKGERGRDRERASNDDVAGRMLLSLQTRRLLRGRWRAARPRIVQRSYGNGTETHTLGLLRQSLDDVESVRGAWRPALEDVERISQGLAAKKVSKVRKNLQVA